MLKRTVDEDERFGRRHELAGELLSDRSHLAMQSAQRRLWHPPRHAARLVDEPGESASDAGRHLARSEDHDASTQFFAEGRLAVPAVHHANAVGAEGAMEDAAVARDDKSRLHAPHAVDERQRLARRTRPAA